ncbi:hypothetical protein Agabi119p4_10515 [Agaricus bisporus var. burnettii]|uniref:Reverse transcriptase domain-containing protein n=1 Tax=Agaricus bisporus var. burnettii TaxID=192524 RepID=A0A8H7C350_AGABI|nr:hypothetical protein Agabi119p4_10515 [Agaricus bisporus var. burnettii]
MYSTPCAFRPIVLLNTLGKLIEKMISTRLQFDGVEYGLFHARQFGGIRQRSTEDAGAFLTHLICAGWAKGLKTSVIAFDMAQFFPSLNHEVLLRVLSQQGFLASVWNFFASYLVGRQTSYRWNMFESPNFQADVGVGQGSALSPVLSALYFSLVMKVFYQRISHSKCDVLSYVDYGTLVCQSRTLDQNLPKLSEAYEETFDIVYSTKAFSTVCTVGMLGNSLRGLSPMHKCLLYRSCVVPVAMYGMNLWYHGFSKSKGHLESLRKMQHRAALWITGAFCTSPNKGVESLAGLIPIHLHIKKLAARAVLRPKPFHA